MRTTGREFARKVPKFASELKCLNFIKDKYIYRIRVLGAVKIYSVIIVSELNYNFRSQILLFPILQYFISSSLQYSI